MSGMRCRSIFRLRADCGQSYWVGMAAGARDTPDARGLCWVEDEVIACRESCSDIDVLGREMGLVVGWGVVAYAAALLERTIGLHWAAGAACQLRQAGPGEMLGGGSIEGFRPGVGYKPGSGRR